jgi:osmoprotectant transport system permease protein
VPCCCSAHAPLAINCQRRRAVPPSPCWLTALGRWHRHGATVTALVLFAVPPVLTNGYVGMREVDRDVVEAARGVGLSPWQVVRTVELPLAVPLLLNGIRLAAVQVIATVTIAALVAGGGLGNIILLGFGTQDQAAVVAGALLVAALALVAEGAFALLARTLEPAGRRRTA